MAPPMLFSGITGVNAFDAGPIEGLANQASNCLWEGACSQQMPQPPVTLQQVSEQIDEMGGPPLGGSYVGGVALLIGGAVALSNTLFNLPRDWLEDWWPMAPIALGAYLVYRARMDETSNPSVGDGDL